MLKADHERVSKLFAKFEGLGDQAHTSREATVATIIEELSVHAGIEETVFYPAVRERFATRDEAIVLEALEEHHLVKVTLNELESLPSQHERYTAKVTVLRELVDHHVEEEETELFKQVRAAFTKSELVELGNELNAARSSAPTRPHPIAPDTPPGNLVSNVVAAPLDAAADLTARAAKAVRGVMS
ncbi:MAG: hemerythrin domain-containing protein [Ilumatobacteraceae bacterium]